jgi:hypothetical protein
MAAHLIILYCITHTVVGEEYRSWSSSLRSFLHSPISWLHNAEVQGTSATKC